VSAASIAALKGQTVTIVRIGANKKYSDNWEKAFGRKAPAKAAVMPRSAAKKSAGKKVAKKSAKKR
jgi:hypothetical protein